MASLLDKYIICLIINIFTLGCYALKLYNTFYSTNLYNYSKSAGFLLMLNNKLSNNLIMLFNYCNRNILILNIKAFLITITYIIYGYNNQNKNMYLEVSETLRENNFNLFRKIYYFFFKKEFLYNDD